MHPIILTKPMKALIVGGGRAAATKLKRLELAGHDITCLSLQFCEAIQQSNATLVEGDFYMLSTHYFNDFDLIYFAFPLPKKESSIYYFEAQIECILQMDKLLSVTSKPELGNFITPATRTKDNITVSVSTAGDSPKRSVELAEKFINSIH